MKKLIFIFLGFLVLILTLGIISVWQISGLQKVGSRENAVFNLQKFQNLNSTTTANSQPWQEFISPDAKFKIDYSLNWLTVKEESILQALVPQEWADKYSLKAVFLAQNFQDGRFSQLIIYQGTFEISIEEIFEKMAETNRDQGWTIDIVELKTGEDEGVFEGKYKGRDGTALHSKEKILINGKEGYWVAFFALEKDWQEFKEEADFIIASAVNLTEWGNLW